MIDHGSDEGSVRDHGVVADQHRTAGEHAHQGQGDGEQHHLPGLPSAAAALGHGVKVPRPLRIRRNRVDRTVEFERAVKLASRDVGEEGSTLVLLDADMDCPAQLATALARPAEAVRPDGMIRVVLAKTGFESRFLAAATSIGGTARHRRFCNASYGSRGDRRCQGRAQLLDGQQQVFPDQPGPSCAGSRLRSSRCPLVSIL